MFVLPEENYLFFTSKLLLPLLKLLRCRVVCDFLSSRAIFGFFVRIVQRRIPRPQRLFAGVFLVGVVSPAAVLAFGRRGYFRLESVVLQKPLDLGRRGTVDAFDVSAPA